MRFELIDWALPAEARRAADYPLFNARFVGVSGFVGLLTALATGAVETSLGDWGGIVTLVYAACAVLALGALRLGVAPRRVFWVLMLLTALQFVFATAVETQLDWTVVMWFALLPLLAVLFGGPKDGGRGLVLAAVGAALAVSLEHHSLFPRGPLAPGMQVIRTASFFCAVFFIAIAFHSLWVRALDQAQTAARARTLFLANMSHELRTPMNGVIGITEILLADEPPEAIRQQLELLRRSGSQMVALVNDILDLTRLESGRVTLERVPIDLRVLSGDVVALLHPIAAEKHLALACEVDAMVPPGVEGDPTRLRQVLTNLVANAVKFTKVGRVTVRVATSAGRLRFEVQDTGIGMSVALQQRLFRPFEQADVSYTRRFGGSGLGLAISQRLVTLMGGFLDVRSREAEGTAIAFEVPCVPCALVAEVVAAPCEPSSRTRRVLLVEDNAVNRHVALALLTRCGCECAVANDGAEALAAIHREHFDVVFMDCHMPNLDGFEATRRIRAMKGAIARTPIVAVTASALNEDLAACRDAGMDEVLTKPLTLIALRQMLERVTAMPS